MIFSLIFLAIFLVVVLAQSTSVSYSQSDTKTISADFSDDLPQSGSVILVARGDDALLEAGNYTCSAGSHFSISASGGAKYSTSLVRQGLARAFLYQLGGASCSIGTQGCNDTETVSTQDDRLGYAEVTSGAEVKITLYDCDSFPCSVTATLGASASCSKSSGGGSGGGGGGGGGGTTYTGSIDVGSNLGGYKGLVNVSKDGSFETDVISYSDSWTTTNSNEKHEYGLEADSIALVGTQNPVWSLTKWFSRYNQYATVTIQWGGDYVFWSSKGAEIYVFNDGWRRILVTTVPAKTYYQLRGLGEGYRIMVYPKQLGQNTFKLFYATETPFLYWDINGTIKHTGYVSITVHAGESWDAVAVYKLGSSSLTVRTNVEEPANLSVLVNSWGDPQTVIVSNSTPYIYEDRGIVYDVVAPRQVYTSVGSPTYNNSVEWSVSTSYKLAYIDISNLYGRFNLSLVLSGDGTQPEAEVRVFKVSGGRYAGEIFNDTISGGWTEYQRTVSGLQLSGDIDRIGIELRSTDPWKLLKVNARASLLAGKLNLTRIEVYIDGALEKIVYGNSVSGVVPVGSNAVVEAVYGEDRSETYMGPVLPGTLVLPVSLSPGVHHADGEFMVRVVNYTGTYLLPLPTEINCSSEYRVEGRRFVRREEFHTLPRVGDRLNFFIMFESPRSADGLGEKKLCIDGQCFTYNVTRLVLSIERVEYNLTHMVIRLRPSYECCPTVPLREHLVYVFIVARRGQPIELGKFVESREDTPVIVVPYSRFQFLEPVKYRIYARFSLSGPVPLQVMPLFTLYYGSVKPLAWDDSRGYIVFSKPYIWRADKEFDPMPWNGSLGEVWVYVEKWRQWFRAGWNGTNFVVDIGRPTWNLRVRIVWVPPDLEDTSILIIPLVQRW